MCPTDTTPDPRDMERMPEEQLIPEGEREVAPKPRGDDIARRPELPGDAKRMPADRPGVQE
jgi:hypothetical protein